jgi:molecular chaperone GrpE
MSNSKPKKPIVNAEDLQNQIKELTDNLLRERADAMNVRRRAEEDRIKLSGYFKASTIKELLPFLDNLDRALAHAPKLEDKSYQEWIKGIEGVHKQLFQILDQIGVEKIKTVGEGFNPELHEAVSMDDSKPGSKEVVTEELASGYRLGDEVIRHAMVRVATQ